MATTPKPAANAPVDVVVGETPAMTEPDDSATLLTNNPRTAIELARRRHLARSGNAGADLGAQAAPGASNAGEAEAQAGSERALPPLAPIRFDHEVPPVQRSEVSRAFPEMTSFPDEEDQFSTVPDIVDGIELPRLVAPNVENLVAGDFEGIAEEEDIDDELTSMPHELPRRSLQPASTRARTFGPAIRRGSPMPPPDPIRRGPDVSDEEVVEQRRRRFGGLRFDALTRSGGDGGRSPWRGRPEPVERDWDDDTTEMAVATEAADEPVWDDPDWDEPLDDPPTPYDEFSEPEEELLDEALIATEDDLLDYQVQIAPELPRMCRTCRDFRPADNGERGWCNNNWAFSHRRMVDADELPCESSLGCWWLPYDDIWLANADAARHSQATPLVDLWLARGDERSAVGAGEGRRRQGS